MKKILAVVLAVAMLASMSVTAAAALTNQAPSDAGIRFEAPGGANPPPPGVFCPDNLPDPTNPIWPAWVTGLSSARLHFGVRNVPTAPANFLSTDAAGVNNVLPVGSPPPFAAGGASANPRVDLVVQAFVNPNLPAGTGGTVLTTNWNLGVQRTHFFVGGVPAASAATAALQSWHLQLNHVQTPGATGTNRVTVTYGPATDLTAAQKPATTGWLNMGAVVSPAVTLNDSTNAVIAAPPGIFGLAYNGALGNAAGNAPIGEIRSGEVQANVVWTWTQIP